MLRASGSHYAIRAEGLGKRYRIGASRRSTSLREALADGAAAATQWLLHPSRRGAGQSDFWALRDVSFDVAAGESVGLIGPNGSGKSTLLKIISRIVSPSEGEARIRGRVGALLEVGTGFHPELTGRDNIFLNGAILGMSAEDTRRRFDRIVEFSGVEAFLGVPIKRYSSGMVMRLAFAVAAHLEPDVLIVDEVLAVGDAEFQRKCLGRMDEVARNGCTVFFVSHNLAAVQRLCHRAILLRGGRMAADGRTAQVIGQYLAESVVRAKPEQWAALPAPHSRKPGRALVSAVRYGDPLRPASYPLSMGPLRIEVEVNAPEAFHGMLAADIQDELGNKLINVDSSKLGQGLLDFPGGRSIWRFDLDTVYLQPGRYIVALWLAAANESTLDYRPMALSIELADPRAGRAEGDMPPQRDGLVPCEARVSGVLGVTA